MLQATPPKVSTENFQRIQKIVKLVSKQEVGLDILSFLRVCDLTVPLEFSRGSSSHCAASMNHNGSRSWLSTAQADQASMTMPPPFHAEPEHQLTLPGNTYRPKAICTVALSRESLFHRSTVCRKLHRECRASMSHHRYHPELYTPSFSDPVSPLSSSIPRTLEKIPYL